MAWKVSKRSSFDKTFKKYKKPLKDEILEIADRIERGEDGEDLHYNWAKFYSWHFGVKPQYRLVYTRYQCLIKSGKKPHCKFDDIEHTDKELLTCDGLIEFILVDTRENFNRLYKMSKKDVDIYRRS